MTNELRDQILNQLKEESSKAENRIKELDGKIKDYAWMRGTVNGGLLAGVARGNIDREADEFRKEKIKLEKTNAWRKEMLAKYK